ncbi:611_t:CDS:10 [Diversispora eburnea]|uniref:611_t:CDS:1 n=1 Tax=Diversispora eburnea TaxID=1213867 RepID=A0A9N8ZZ45_9GLOM|nr:611_t:CDS:10 [Diversispora eburnea]
MLRDDNLKLLYDNFTNGFQVIQDTTYDDGTILLRIRPNEDINCTNSMIRLRLIMTDGSILKIDVNSNNTGKYQLLSENFCQIQPGVSFSLNQNLSNRNSLNNQIDTTSSLFTPDGINYYEDSINIYAISRNYILITYLCGNDTRYNVCGIIVDWLGNVLSYDIPLGENCDDVNIAQNLDPQSGFLWVCYLNASSQLLWKEFSIPDSEGIMKELRTGTLNNIRNFSPNYTSIFPLEDGGYGIVTAQFNGSNLLSLSFPPWTVLVNFIPVTGNETSGPFQIFNQNDIALNSVNVFGCTISFASFGYNCIIHHVDIFTRRTFLNLEFLRSGALIDTNTINVYNNNGFDILDMGGSIVWNAETLFKGGYLILTENVVEPNHTISGRVFNNNGTLHGDWGMPNTYNYTRHVGIFPNNTIWGISINNLSNTWTFVSSFSLSDYRTTSDPGGYDNAFINSTDPKKSEFINSKDTKKIVINFISEITLSNGNISIWQLNMSSSLTSSTSTTISSLLKNGNSTIEFDVIESTFNQEGVIYFITMENGFVKDTARDQPLLGIRPLTWNFTTRIIDGDNVVVNQDSANAIIRLTSSGSKYYISLSTVEQKLFTQELSKELSNIIPCSDSRIKMNRHFQFDKDTEETQILMRVEIDSPPSITNSSSILKEKSSLSVISDMDLLIRNKSFTLISQRPYTSLLDEKFGSQVTPDLWEKYKWILLGLSLGLFLLFILLWFSYKKNPKAQNFIVAMYIFILVDFVLDVLFLTYNSSDLDWIFETFASIGRESSEKLSDASEVSEVSRTSYNNNGEGGVISTNPQVRPVFNIRDPTDESLAPTVKTVPSIKLADSIIEIEDPLMSAKVTSPTSIISNNPMIPTGEGYTSKMIEQFDLTPTEKQLMSSSRTSSSSKSKKGLFSGSRSSKKKSKDSSSSVVIGGEGPSRSLSSDKDLCTATQI